MFTTKELKLFRPIERIFANVSKALAVYYCLTTPAEFVNDTIREQQEKARQARLTSTIILLSIIILLLIFLASLFAGHKFFAMFIVPALLIQGVALVLNRRGHIYLSGLLVVAWFGLGLGAFLLFMPGGLKVSDLPAFYMLIELELLAVSLLPAGSVFLVALLCSLFIVGNLLLRPHSPDLERLLATSGYQVILQPILMQIMVAIVSYLWVRSAKDAIERADHAEEIARLMHTLAEEKEHRIEALEAEHAISLAYEHQRKLNRLKDQFLVNISHELRTPLTSINGYLELLKDYEEQLDTQTVKLFLTNAMQGCEELTLLVNDVMDAMTLTEKMPKPKCEAILVARLVQDVIRQLEPLALASYKFQIIVPEDLQIWADQQYCRQVLRNLLSNACKYTPKGTCISVEATHTHHSSPVCISVQDSGPGIPQEEQPLLFEKFVRLKRDLAGVTRGTGLGLYVSKHLVEAMDGRIWVESTGCPGEGSRFSFTLPCFN